MSGRSQILIVGAMDAERTARAVLLAQAGYDVREAEPDEVLCLAGAGETPNLVIFDRAPVCPSFCDALKREHPDLFVLQTFAVDGGAQDAELPESIDASLREPVDPRELLTMVRSLLRLQRVEARLRDSEQRLELAQDSAGFAVLDWNIPANSFVHSAMFAELFDLPQRGADVPLSPLDLAQRIHPDDFGGLRDAFSKQTEAYSFDQEFRIIRADGAVRWIASRGRFLLGAGGAVDRMISLNFDITARREAERVNAQLASIVTSSTDAIVSVDLTNAVTTWNAGAERLFGHAAADMIGRTLDDVLHDDEAERRDHRDKLLRGEAWVLETRQKTKGGEPIDIAINSAPMFGPDGSVIGASLIVRDIAPQKTREDHVRFLMRELTHRSKNLLAVIQAMARQSLNKEIAPDEFVKRFSNRLNGLAGSHDLLSSVDWRGVSLVDLIRSQLRHYEDLFDTQISLDGADLVIRPEAAQNIGIALHELSTNAAKYGALSTSEGRVTITWRVEDNPSGAPRLTVTWREAEGPTVVPPTRRGFGHVVMGRVAGPAMNGTSLMQFPPSGVIWTLNVPAASVLCD